MSDDFERNIKHTAPQECALDLKELKDKKLGIYFTPSQLLSKDASRLIKFFERINFKPIALTNANAKYNND